MKLVPVKSVDNRSILFPYGGGPTPARPDKGPDRQRGDRRLAIRQAINDAVDRAALVEGVLEGFGSPAIGPVDGLPWFEPRRRWPTTTSRRAKKILADGGWKDSDGDGIVELNGQAARFTLVYPGTDTTRQGLPWPPAT